MVGSVTCWYCWSSGLAAGFCEIGGGRPICLLASVPSWRQTDSSGLARGNGCRPCEGRGRPPPFYLSRRRERLTRTVHPRLPWLCRECIAHKNDQMLLVLMLPAGKLEGDVKSQKQIKDQPQHNVQYICWHVAFQMVIETLGLIQVQYCNLNMH